MFSDRFFAIYNELLRQAAFKTKTSFAQSIGTYASIVNDVFKAKRMLTVEQLDNLRKKYHVNLNYLLSGEGGMFEESKPIYKIAQDQMVAQDGQVEYKINQGSQAVEACKSEIAVLKERIKLLETLLKSEQDKNKELLDDKMFLQNLIRNQDDRKKT